MTDGQSGSGGLAIEYPWVRNPKNGYTIEKAIKDLRIDKNSV